MGHRAGWLALGAGLAGGADVILIPEIPYLKKVARAIRQSNHGGTASVSWPWPKARCRGQYAARLGAKARKSKARRKNAGAARAEIASSMNKHVSNTLASPINSSG